MQKCLISFIKIFCLTFLKDFISKLLVLDPKKRLTSAQALTKPWILGKATKFDNMVSALNSMKALVNRKKTQVNYRKKFLFSYFLN